MKTTPTRTKLKIKTPVKVHLDYDMEDSHSNDVRSIYQKYKFSLSTTIKSDLVYRENEVKEIEDFLQIHLKTEKSSSIYVSGPPGTGKCVLNYLIKFRYI